MKPDFFKIRHLPKLDVYLILKNQGLFGGPKNQFHRTISGPPEAVNFYTRIIMVRPTKNSRQKLKMRNNQKYGVFGFQLITEVY